MITDPYSFSPVDILIKDIDDCCSGTVNLGCVTVHNKWKLSAVCQHGFFSAEAVQFSHGLILIYNKVARAHHDKEE